MFYGAYGIAVLLVCSRIVGWDEGPISTNKMTHFAVTLDRFSSSSLLFLLSLSVAFNLLVSSFSFAKILKESSAPYCYACKIRHQNDHPIQMDLLDKILTLKSGLPGRKWRIQVTRGDVDAKDRERLCHNLPQYRQYQILYCCHSPRRRVCKLG